VSVYETAFQILHKLRAGMVRPERDRIGGNPNDHVEVDETRVGDKTRGLGRGVHDQTLVIAAVEVRRRKPKVGGSVLRRHGRYAGRIRLEAIPHRSANTLIGFVKVRSNRALRWSQTGGVDTTRSLRRATGMFRSQWPVIRHWLRTTYPSCI